MRFPLRDACLIDVVAFVDSVSRLMQVNGGLPNCLLASKEKFVFLGDEQYFPLASLLADNVTVLQRIWDGRLREEGRVRETVGVCSSVENRWDRFLLLLSFADDGESHFRLTWVVAHRNVKQWKDRVALFRLDEMKRDGVCTGHDFLELGGGDVGGLIGRFAPFGPRNDFVVVKICFPSECVVEFVGSSFP